MSFMLYDDLSPEDNDSRKKLKRNDDHYYLSWFNRSYDFSPEQELSLIAHTIKLKPVGINKYLNMLLIREQLCEDLKINIPSACIWNYLNTKFDLSIDNTEESLPIPILTEKSDFTLPFDEYKDLIIAENEKIQRREKKIRGTTSEEKFKGLHVSDQMIKEMMKTKFKVDSKSSINLGSVVNKIVSVPPLNNSLMEKDEVVSDGVSSSKISLNTDEKEEGRKEQYNDVLNVRMLERVKEITSEYTDLKHFELMIINSLDQSLNLETDKNDPNCKIKKVDDTSETSFNLESSTCTKSLEKNKFELTNSDSPSTTLASEILSETVSQHSAPTTEFEISNLCSDNKNGKPEVNTQVQLKRNVLHKEDISRLIPVKGEKHYSLALLRNQAYISKRSNKNETKKK